MDQRRRRRTADQEALAEFQRLLLQGLAAFRRAGRRPLAEDARRIIRRRRGRRNLVFQNWAAERALRQGAFARDEEEEEEEDEPMIEVEPGELEEPAGEPNIPRGILEVDLANFENGIWYTVLELQKRYALWRLVRRQADDRVRELSWNVYEDYLFTPILRNQERTHRPLIPSIPVWDGLEVDFMHYAMHFLPHAFNFPLGFSFHIGRAKRAQEGRWDVYNDSWARPLMNYIDGGYGEDTIITVNHVDANISARLDAAIGEFILVRPNTEAALENFLRDFWRNREMELEDRWQPVQFITVNMAHETLRVFRIFRNGRHPDLLRPGEEWNQDFWEGRNTAYFDQVTRNILDEAVRRNGAFDRFREQVSSFLVMSVHEQLWDQVRVGNRVTRNLRRVKFDVHIERNSHIRHRLHVLILVTRAILGTLLRFRCSRLYMRYERWRRRPDLRIRVNAVSRRPNGGGAVNFHVHQLLRPDTVAEIVDWLSAVGSSMNDLNRAHGDWNHCPDLLETNILEFIQRDLSAMFHPLAQSWQRLSPWEFDIPYEQGSDVVLDNPERIVNLELDRIGIVFEAGPVLFFHGDPLYNDINLNNWDQLSDLLSPHFALMRSFVASTDPL